VKRQVRQRSKFGCVLCRFAICQYEHIDPAYKDARAHEPENICLLCGNCHDRVTNGRIAKSQVQAAYRDIQSDCSVKSPFEDLALTSPTLSVKLGGMIFHAPKTLIRVNGIDLLTIAAPEADKGIPSLSGVFYDSTGVEILRIDNNIWSGSIESWDLSVTANRVTIRSAPRKIELVMSVSPPNLIEINRLNMFFDGCYFHATEEEFVFGYSLPAGNYSYLGFNTMQSWGALVGINADLRKIQPNMPFSLSMKGGEGVALGGSGLSVAVGAGKMLIDRLRVWEADSTLQPVLPELHQPSGF